MLGNGKIVKENNIKNSVALVYRFMPALSLLKRELEKETIGKIIDFKVRTYHDSYLNERKKIHGELVKILVVGHYWI